MEWLKIVVESLKRMIDKKAESLDWGENDPSSKSYIKNRPFYKATEDVVLVSRSFTFEQPVDWSGDLDGYLVENLGKFSLEPDQMYTVSIDGSEYLCKAFVEDEYGNVVVGNGAYIGAANSDNGLPFAIGEYELGSMNTYAILPTEGVHSIRLSFKQEVVSKIPSEYLPEIDLGLSPVALSGQYADLDGKPTFASVATSGSYTDLSNKPSLSEVATSGSYTDLSNKPSLSKVATSGSYYDLSCKPIYGTGYDDGGKVIEWDGSTDDREIFEYDGEEYYLISTDVSHNDLGRLEVALVSWRKVKATAGSYTTEPTTFREPLGSSKETEFGYGLVCHPSYGYMAVLVTESSYATPGLYFKRSRYTTIGGLATCLIITRMELSDPCVVSDYPIVLRSSTEGSEERFKLSVNDAGAITVSGIGQDDTPAREVILASESPTAHQQLVTDADGVAKWEDMLAFTGITKNVLYEGDLTFYENPYTAGTYLANGVRVDVYGVLNDYRDSSNVLLFCELNGVEIPMPYLGLDFTERWGNGYLMSPSEYDDNGGNLYVEQYATGNYSQLTFYSREPGDYHVKLYGKGEIIKPIDPKFLPSEAVTEDEIHTVAKSGSWNDLTDRPFYTTLDSIFDFGIDPSKGYDEQSYNGGTYERLDPNFITITYPANEEFIGMVQYLVGSTVVIHNADEYTPDYVITADDIDENGNLSCSPLGGDSKLTIDNTTGIAVLQAMVYMTGTVMRPHQCKAIGWVYVTPIDDRYMPTTVPVIQSAQVGQMIAVKAVDENSKPTGWGVVSETTSAEVLTWLTEEGLIQPAMADENSIYTDNSGAIYVL